MAALVMVAPAAESTSVVWYFTMSAGTSSTAKAEIICVSSFSVTWTSLTASSVSTTFTVTSPCMP